jgi:hypothetical protein
VPNGGLVHFISIMVEISVSISAIFSQISYLYRIGLKEWNIDPALI